MGVLRTMMEIRDHREADAGKGDPEPLTPRDLTTCLTLVRRQGLYDSETWLHHREFPAMSRALGYDYHPSELKDADMPWDGDAACALVNRVGEKLGLAPLGEPLARRLLSAFSSVSPTPRLRVAAA
jgi:hypothetical protein